MALALGLIHTTLGRAILPLPESGTKLAPQRQAAMGSAQEGPCCPRCCPVLWSCLEKQLSTVAPSRERPWHHGKSGDGITAQLSGM